METKDMIVTTHELAASSSQAMAKAEIECAYIMAVRRPRNIADVRVKILDACKRPVFAATAEYAKPIGGGRTIKGPSIRFAETALQCLGNVRTVETVIYEDDSVRKIHISVVDLENNNSYGTEVTIQKTVERKKVRDGQTILSERQNSAGETTYLVEATEDETKTKQGAAASKMIRNCGLRLIPRDIIEEAMETARETRNKSQSDPEAAKNKVIDGFSGLGVKPSDLEKFLRKPLLQILPKDLDELRKVYTSLRDGESVWPDWLEDIEPEKKLSEKLKAAEKTVTPEQMKAAATPTAGTPKAPPAKTAPAGLRQFDCPWCHTLYTGSDNPGFCKVCKKPGLVERVDAKKPLTECQQALGAIPADIMVKARDACNLVGVPLEKLTDDACSALMDAAKEIDNAKSDGRNW